MQLVKIQYNNFHCVATVQIDIYFNSLFDYKLRELPSVQQLTVDQEVCHKIMANRWIPTTIRPQHKDELERMTAMGVTTPVDEPTSWVSQVVVVKKSSGALRMCSRPSRTQQGVAA